MNKYKFLYLFWLLPAYFLFLGLHQTTVYFGMQSTYENGSSFVASIVDSQIEQIASQTSGSLRIQFQTTQNDTVQQLLSLPAAAVSKIGKEGMIPIRYEKGAFVEIVIMPTYQMQQKFVLSNIAMTAVALFITFFVALAAHRKARKKRSEDKKEWVVERVD